MLDIGIAPTAFCINYVKIDHKNKPLVDSVCDEGDIFWLGLDKYRKVLYGLRDIESGDTEIVMRSIYREEIKIIKTLRHLLDFGSQLDASISSCGCFALFAPYEVNFADCFRIDLFSFETGVIQEYNCTFPFQKYFLDRFWHYSSVGWIVVGENDESIFQIYRLVFNDLDKTCELCFIADIPEDVTADSFFRPTVCGQSFKFVATDFCSLVAFDFQTNLWSEEELFDVPNDITNEFNEVTAEYDTYFIFASETEQSLFAVPTSINSEDLFVYKLLENHWGKMFSLICLDEDDYNAHADVYSKNSFSCAGFLMVKLEYGISILSGTNVQPLKNLAMKQILDCFKYLTIKQIMDSMDMPWVLKRQFLGPVWTWNGEESE